MKGLLLKLFSIIIGLGTIFFMGSSAGKKKEQNKQLKDQYDEILDDVKINKNVDNMGFADKSNFLLSKQKNKDNT